MPTKPTKYFSALICCNCIRERISHPTPTQTSLCPLLSWIQPYCNVVHLERDPGWRQMIYGVFSLCRSTWSIFFWARFLLKIKANDASRYLRQHEAIAQRIPNKNPILDKKSRSSFSYESFATENVGIYKPAAECGLIIQCIAFFQNNNVK